jgi:phosphomannomutase
VADRKLDLGVVVDPDVDRLALIDERGDMFGEEYTLVLVADYVLQHEPGPAVSNLSSSRALADIAARHGQAYHASAVGEVNVVQKMKAVGATIGGEGNGGIIYPASHYGRDALVGIALALTHIAKLGQPLSAIRSSYPAYYMAKQKIEATPGIDLQPVLDGLAKQALETWPNEAELDTIDGLKINLQNSWAHLRKSNTEPIIRVYTEAVSADAALDLANQVREMALSLL